MEQISFEDTARKMSSQLESTLGRLAIAADSHMSTWKLEAEAQKLAGKLKAAASILTDEEIYRGVEGSKVYYPETDLPDNLFLQYAALCKICNEGLSVNKEAENYFAQITDNVFVKLIPSRDKMPKFKVKIEGRTLMAVRTDLYDKLPQSVQKLLEKGEEDED